MRTQKNIELAAKAQVEKNLERQRQFAVSQLINSAAATGVSQTSSANSALSSISQDTAIKQGLLEQQTNFANDLTALNEREAEANQSSTIFGDIANLTGQAFQIL